MLWLLLADSVVILHLGFVLFVVGGGLLVLRWRKIAWLHLPAVAWGALTECLHIVCPLTYLEDRLRSLAGATGYQGDFVSHYLLPILYPPNLTGQVQLILGATVLIINIGIYAWLLWRR